MTPRPPPGPQTRSHSMCFIRRGKADAVGDDGVSVVQTYMPGDFFGEHSLLGFEPREASVRAVEFVEALVLQRGDFMELYVSAPEFVRELQRIDVLRSSLAATRKAVALKVLPVRRSGANSAATLLRLTAAARTNAAAIAAATAASSTSPTARLLSAKVSPSDAVDDGDVQSLARLPVPVPVPAPASIPVSATATETARAASAPVRGTAIHGASMSV